MWKHYTRTVSKILKGEAMVRKERLISMLFAVILTIGTIAGSVHAAEAPGDGHNSEIEESKYRIVLDANGGYFDHEWDDIREEYVEKEEIVNKVIKPGEAIKTVPVMETDAAEATFLGWSKERDGGILPQEEDGGYVPEKDCTLYALWEIEETGTEESETEEAEDPDTEITENTEPEDTEEPEALEDPAGTEEPEALAATEAATASAEAAAEETSEEAVTAMTTESEIAAEEPETAAVAMTAETEVAAEEEPDAAVTAMTAETEIAAEEEPGAVTASAAADTAIVAEELEKADHKEAAQAETKDFVLTIYAEHGAMTSSTNAAAGDYGHSWLSITNNSATGYDFHGYEIRPGYTMDLGLWGDQSLNANGLGGVFLNRESWEIRLSSVKCYSLAVSKKAVNRIKDAAPAESYYHDGYMANTWNVHDNLLHNCTTFAVKMWNRAVGITENFDIDIIDEPLLLEEKIDQRNTDRKRQVKDTGRYSSLPAGADYVYHVNRAGELIPVHTLALSVNEAALRKGESVKLTAKYVNDDLSDSKVVWRSSDTRIAAVEKGTVRGVKGGNCTITASLEDKWEAKCDVTVVSGEIYSVQDLKAVSKFPGDSYVLMNDLDLRNEEWTPIGTASAPFTGDFNGNGHSISGLKVSGNSDYSGLFGKISNAAVLRLSVYGNVSGHEYVGGIAGLADNSDLSFCINYATVNGVDQVGGVIGRVYQSTMEYCMNDGAVSASGRACGGVTSDIYPSGSVTYCLNLGRVSGGTDLTGGITGGSTRGTVSSCINAAAVSYRGGYAGAIAGDNSSYSGSRADNFFLKTSTINSGFRVIGTGSGTVVSASDRKVIDLKDKILGGRGGTRQDQPLKVSIVRKIVAGRTATVSVTGCDGKLSFTSSNPSVAEVTSKGKVTAKKPGKVKITVKAAETSFYKAASKTIEISVVPKAPAEVSAVNLISGVKLSWSRVPGATYYVIYKNGLRFKKIEKSSTAAYIDRAATANGKTYTYTVYACSPEGAGGSRKCKICRLKRPDISFLWALSRGNMLVVSERDPDADGFVIQYSQNRLFISRKKTIFVPGNGRLTYFIGDLAINKRYYVRVRTYRKTDGKVYYSTWSRVNSIRTFN